MSRTTVVAIALLFGIPFAVAGLFCTWLLAKNVIASMEANGWVEAPAEVISAELKELRRPNSNTITWQANGAYRYQYNGKSYDSTRLAIDLMQGSDNIGSWHKDVVARLEAAKAAKKPITVWVNPADPTQAVADRSLRWGMILFMLPFALVFTALGVAAAWFARLAWKLA